MKKAIFWIKISTLYFFLPIGAVWQILGRYERATEALAAPFMAALAIWAFLEYFVRIESKSAKIKFVFFYVLISAATWGVEVLGVKTGFPFGDYLYSQALAPNLAGVPIVIGFSWASVFLISRALVGVIPKIKKGFSAIISASLAIVLFDAILEPAATKLNYWTWDSGSPPFENYVSWFAIGFVISLVYERLNFDLKKTPTFCVHIFAAQIIYFVLCYFV